MNQLSDKKTTLASALKAVEIPSNLLHETVITQTKEREMLTDDPEFGIFRIVACFFHPEQHRTGNKAPDEIMDVDMLLQV